jgi:hypothetical protein
MEEIKMSGIKETYITMTSSEANRLRNSVRLAEESAQQAQQREQRVQNALNAANKERESLNRTLSNEIAGLHDDLRQMSNEQNRRLQEQAAEYNKKLQKQQSSIDDVKQQAEKNRRSLQNQINGIHARIEAKEDNAKKLAEYWISNTQAYLNDIDRLRHEMFTPGQLERLRGKLEQMRSDIKNGVYEAAIATARGLFHDAVDLKEAVGNAEAEWGFYHDLFVKTLATTEANLDGNKVLQFTFEMEHGVETVDARVNYWTDGALDEVSESIARAKLQTEQIRQVPTQQLIDYIDTLNQLNVKMEVAVAEAKNVMLLSQKRAEMADKLADALEEVMWKCERVVYEGGEQNQPVHVKLSDGMGNEIVAIITPEIGTQNMTNKLELNFFDEENDERQRQEWITSLHNCLREEGLEVGEARCVAGYEAKPSDNTALKNIDDTAQRKIERHGEAKRKTS